MSEVNAAKDAASGSTFPVKLHKLLESIEEGSPHADIISWLPGGKTFKVHRKDEFASTFLPAFSNASKFKSFQRNLNLWNFNTVSKGPEKGVCSHPHFVQGKPELVKQMKRISVKGTRVRRSSSSHNTPLEGRHSSSGTVASASSADVSAAHVSAGNPYFASATIPPQAVPKALSPHHSFSSAPRTNDLASIVSDDHIWRAALSQAAQEMLSARLQNALMSGPVAGQGFNVMQAPPTTPVSQLSSVNELAMREWMAATMATQSVRSHPSLCTPPAAPANPAYSSNLLTLLAAARAGY